MLVGPWAKGLGEPMLGITAKPRQQLPPTLSCVAWASRARGWRRMELRHPPQQLLGLGAAASLGATHVPAGITGGQ